VICSLHIGVDWMVDVVSFSVVGEYWIAVGKRRKVRLNVRSCYFIDVSPRHTSRARPGHSPLFAHFGSDSSD